MNTRTKTVLSLETAAVAIALSTLASPTVAFAQDAAPATPEAECTAGQADNCTAPDSKAIVVTGSRIARPNLESVVPIASVVGEDFLKQGDTNIGDALNDLPQLRSTFSQQNPGLGIGIAGLNLLDLRGLGTQRTLVLVNGRRHVPADILNNAVSPDVNSIPNDLIERVDIVTGGNSAVYGSDAIAGVVNFVLRRNYQGLQLRGTAGVSARGFGGNQFFSVMAGKNFNDGAGNITLHGEYAHQDRVFASQIPWYMSNDGFGTVDLDTTGLAQNSDGYADRSFFRDFRSASINRFGLIPITQRTGNPVCGQGLIATNGQSASQTGTALNQMGASFNCTYLFDAAGNMTAQTGTRFGSGIIGSIIGGNGQIGREDKLVSVLPKLDRYNFNVLSHYTFDDAFEVFFEGKYNKVIAQGSNAGPSFIQGTFSQFDFRERVRLDNPFLTPTQRTTIANAILASGCNTSLTVQCVTASTPTQGLLTPAQIGQINAGTYRFVIARTLADSGIRDEKFDRTTWRVVGGFRGTFNEDWNYEVSVNYGKFEEKTTTYGYLDKQRFMLSMDAGLDPADNTIKCRAKFDPASAVQFGTSAANAARLATDIAACVPYNPFGGKDNSAATKYFSYNAHHQSSIDQLVVNAFVSGDTSQLLNLPGGPIRFALGGEYRRERSFYKQDPFVENGFTNAVVIPTFAPDPFEVREGFGEIQIPLLADMPFFQELTLSGATRVAHYQGSTGTVWAYNAGAEWSPMKGLRFRANYGRSVRAPNVSETAFPLVPNFAPGFSDPCRATAIATGTTYRAANCATDLGTLLAGIPDLTYSLAVVSGSNPDLQAEKSDSWTFGGVLQPEFIPGLSISVDYYNINVKGVIVSLTAQQIANSCYDLPTLTNAFCGLFQRWRGPGAGSLGEAPGQIQANTMIQAPLNYARRQRRGIDTQVTYRHNFGEGLKLYTNLIYSHNLTASNYQDPTQPNFENRILGEIGDPIDEFRWDTDLTVGKVTLGYRMHYIGPMVTNNWEDFFPLQDRSPQDADWADIQKFPSVFYHDVRMEVNLDGAGFGKDFNWYIGVNNLTDVKPPLGSTATGSGSAIYEWRGRNFYTGFRARF